MIKKRKKNCEQVSVCMDKTKRHPAYIRGTAYGVRCIHSVYVPADEKMAIFIQFTFIEEFLSN